MWEEFGYSNETDFFAKELMLNHDVIDYAELALNTNDPQKALGLNDAVAQGKKIRPSGTSKEATIRRLRKNHPELHQKVVSGEMTPNAAAIEAGFRRKMKSIPVDSPEVALKALEKVFSREELLAAMGVSKSDTKPTDDEPALPDGPSLDDYVEAILKGVAKTPADKIRRNFKRLMANLKRDFHAQLDEQVQDAVAARTARLLQFEADAKATQDAASDFLMSVQVKMTQDEFNQIRGCLHPDKQPEEKRARYSKAFEAFNRLKPVIPKGIPLAALRKSGWEKAHPRYNPKSV